MKGGFSYSHVHVYIIAIVEGGEETVTNCPAPLIRHEIFSWQRSERRGEKKKELRKKEEREKGRRKETGFSF